jgi:hypothetical protein
VKRAEVKIQHAKALASLEEAEQLMQQAREAASKAKEHLVGLLADPLEDALNGSEQEDEHDHVTVFVFWGLLLGNLFAAGWHAREFWLHAREKRLKLAQWVLFTGPLGWCAFVGRELHLLHVGLASFLVWVAVVGTVLHVLSILSRIAQARAS